MGRPSREDAERIGESILAAATEMFLAQGYGATSIEAIAHLLADRLPPDEARFAAAQFLQMVISLPQHSALGIAPKMSKEDHRLWVRRTVSLFLDGCLHWGK